jgi:hypothetical protein
MLPRFQKRFSWLWLGEGFCRWKIEPQPALKVLAVELQSILDDNTTSDVPHYH